MADKSYRQGCIQNHRQKWELNQVFSAVEECLKCLSTRLKPNKSCQWNVFSIKIIKSRASMGTCQFYWKTYFVGEKDGETCCFDTGICWTQGAVELVVPVLPALMAASACGCRCCQLKIILPVNTYKRGDDLMTEGYASGCSVTW